MDPKIFISFYVFTAILLLVLGIQQLKRKDQQMVANRVEKLTAEDIKKKLSQAYNNEHKDLGRKMLASLSELSIAKRLGRNVDKKLEEADVPLRGEEFVVIVFTTGGGTTLLVTAITLNPVTGLLLGITAGIIPFLLLNRARTKRLNEFNSQVGEALTIMANSMRSGFSFLQSMDMVRKEMPDPISKEFGRTFQEINLGTSTEEALQNMAKRVNSEDLDLVITAVLIQRQVGGNLAEVLDNIAGTIRERIRIKGEIKTLTAQGRMSGWVIGLLPIILGALMFVINPSYIMELFTTQIGLMLLTAAVMGEIIGIILIKRIVNIRV